MFKYNDTAAFVHHLFVSEDFAYVRKEARKRDNSHLEKQHKAAIIAYKEKQISERREKAALKEQKENDEKIRLASIKLLEEEDDVTDAMVNTQLQDQLAIYRDLVEGVPKKSHLKNKAMMIDALKNAIMKYKEGKSV